MKKDLFKQRLTSEQWDILKKATRDPFFFSNFIKLIHPIRGKVPFALFPYQRACLWAFLNHQFNIVLKFRQAGLTELISMYCLWLAMYRPHKNIVIISIKDRVAKKVLRKIKFMYRNLPDYLKMPVVNGRGDDIGTATEIEFANGSLITSIPTTEEAGRSEAVSLLVIDEGAIVRWINKIWAAAFPTLSTGGAAIVNSTPYGVGNWYHKTWVDALEGGNEFNPIRLKWEMHPERDINWYNQMRAQLGPRKTAQEIDGDFLTSGNNVFDLVDIRAIEDCLDEHMPLDLVDMPLIKKVAAKTGMLPNFRAYKAPEPNKKYWVAGDIATGRANDYSTITVFDRYGEEMASMKAKIGVTPMADLMMAVGKTYNMATLAPESNDVGLATTSRVESEGYPNLYYSTALVKEKGEKKAKEKILPGWYTTKQNRPIIITNLEEDIREGNVIIKDPAFVQEAYTFIYDNANKPIAMGKGGSTSTVEAEDDTQVYTDDAIMGKSIGNHIRKGKIKAPIIAPR